MKAKVITILKKASVFLFLTLTIFSAILSAGTGIVVGLALLVWGMGYLVSQTTMFILTAYPSLIPTVDLYQNEISIAMFGVIGTLVASVFIASSYVLETTAKKVKRGK